MIGALASQVKPRFTAPAAAAAVFGALLAPRLDLLIGAIHLLATILALYVAHLRDERLDAHVRGEEEPMVSDTLLQYAIPTASGLFLVAWGTLFVLSGTLPAVLTLVPWLLGLLHAPYLDANPVTTSLDYPVAVAAVIAGGYAAQTGEVSDWLLWVVRHSYSY